MTKFDKEQKLQKIAQEIEKCKICKVGKSGMSVPGEGSADAKTVFLGEAPGKQEAKTGRPFIGRSGQLLRSLIREVGLKEEDVYITSPVKYLPDYITPTRADIEHGKTHLRKQLDVIQPKFVVLLGNVAAKAMLDNPLPVTKSHGEVIESEGMKLFPTFHPAAALRSTTTKELLKKDFLKLKVLIGAKS